jgi:hypothetical protein
MAEQHVKIRWNGTAGDTSRPAIQAAYDMSRVRGLPVVVYRRFSERSNRPGGWLYSTLIEQSVTWFISVKGEPAPLNAEVFAEIIWSWVKL